MIGIFGKSSLGSDEIGITLKITEVFAKFAKCEKLEDALTLHRLDIHISQRLRNATCYGVGGLVLYGEVMLRFRATVLNVEGEFEFSGPIYLTLPKHGRIGAILPLGFYSAHQLWPTSPLKFGVTGAEEWGRFADTIASLAPVPA